MRQVIVFCTLVLLIGLGLSRSVVAQTNGQATVISGYASNWAVSPGVYPIPLAPIIATPSLDFASPPTQGGARNATPENDSVVSPIVWNGPAITVIDESSENAGAAVSEIFDSGSARFSSSYGAAELVAASHAAKAAKTYTNQDVAQFNQTNGIVKYGSKTEHLD